MFRAVHGSLRLAGQCRRGARDALGLGWVPRVLPYVGFGDLQTCRVLARVVEDRGVLEPRLARGWVAGVYASYRRFHTAELPAFPVEIRWGDQTIVAATDEEGFLSATLAVPEGTPPGVHHVSLRANLQHGARVSPQETAPVLLLGAPSFGVISDIDDTLIDANIQSRLSRARAMLLSEVDVRHPFPAAATLCQQLVGGQPTSAQATPETARPIFYVSSSPWNLFDHVALWLSVHGFPQGPILLRDWGIRRDGFSPDGRHTHKLDKISELFAVFAALPFVLLGDSSQDDPVHYLTLVRRQPGRVLAVLIRRVAMRADRARRLLALEAAYAAEGVPFLLFDHSEEALLWLRERGHLGAQAKALADQAP